MKRSAWRITTVVSLILYGALFIASAVICLLYTYYWDSSIGRNLAYFAMDLNGIMLIPIPLVGIAAAILGIPSKGEKYRRRWVILAIISPFYYLLLWIAALCIFVSATGGV